MMGEVQLSTFLLESYEKREGLFFSGFVVLIDSFVLKRFSIHI